MTSRSRDGATPLPWLGGLPPDGSLEPGDLLRPVERVARHLLGCRLVSTVGGVRSEGVIVETEAYGGLDDPASHAAVKAGRTARNRSMFGPPGHAYVYRIYGVHWCLNVVTGQEGDPQAVLIRGVDPVSGQDVMTRRRGGVRPLAAGPGRLCQALGIDGTLDGHDLSGLPLRLSAGWRVPDACVGRTRRIGISRAAAWPLRFYVRCAQGVTPGGPDDIQASENE